MAKKCHNYYDHDFSRSNADKVSFLEQALERHHAPIDPPACYEPGERLSPPSQLPIDNAEVSIPLPNCLSFDFAHDDLDFANDDAHWYDDVAYEYEFTQLEDAPAQVSEALVDCVPVCDPIVTKQSLDDKIPLCVLQSVQDTFAAVIPTIMSGVQAHVEKLTSNIVVQLDPQVAQIASLAGRVAATACADQAKQKSNQKKKT